MYRVEGFLFETKEQAQTAQKEVEGIRYIKGQTHMDDAQTVLELYNRLILKEVFVTPVGFAFLGELREQLIRNPFISNGDILPIPVFHPGAAPGAEDSGDAYHVSREGSREYEKRRARAERDLRANRKETIRRNRVKEKERERAAYLAEQKIRYSGKNYRKQFMVSTFLAVVFAFGLIGMFLITALGTNNVNIINYENEIIDRYEAWDRELTEREAAIRLREVELGIQNGAEETGLDDAAGDTLQP